MKALVIEAPGEGLHLQEVDTPKATPGTVVVKVLAVQIEGDFPVILSEHSPFTWPQPFTPGSHLVGRVTGTSPPSHSCIVPPRHRNLTLLVLIEAGPDAAVLAPGQLVLVDIFFRARDDPTNTQILWGLFDGPTPASKKFMKDNYALGGYAAYTRVPLENALPLNESILCGQMGYSFAELIYLATYFVSYGGFRGMDLKAGEQVIVAPATGNFSGAAVTVALAMGARVIAIGRNKEALEVLMKRFPHRVNVVQVTGDVGKDTAALMAFGEVDAYLDISPYQAAGSTHFGSCFNAVRSYGRVSLMGVVSDNIAVPYVQAVMKNLTIRGQYMYEREDALRVIKLAEAGILKLGKEVGCEVVGTFKLEEVEEGLKTAAANHKGGKMTIIEP